ncbi:hypothetical protein I553_1186 [Mycobacterium xenopi 4042]|uniref:Uncharacterized protein n=1 Tax=Mycobacterium xenopi 4042 TaxID=1299334 RepID=X7ZB29_MYCXE|nr:hypothetical protein I553_1186 [Mycobacterium xenopi 4042]
MEACLRIPTLPAISAGAANRTACQSGKFHGMTASTTPAVDTGYRPWPRHCDGIGRLVSQQLFGIGRVVTKSFGTLKNFCLCRR